MSDQRDFSFLSRDELLGGLPARRASTLLFAIESRTAYLIARTRQAAARIPVEQTAKNQERAFLDALARGRDLPVRPAIQDLERYAPEWASLVPNDIGVRAAVAHLLGDTYIFAWTDVPELRRALGLDDEAVKEDFQRRYERPLDRIFASHISRLERLRWIWSRLAGRLEHLPPFWTVFALTLTETVGAGILALPIAVAGIGPMGGVALLVVLGLVNVLSIAALTEAFTRSGKVRYGHAYFARVVADYLGDNAGPLSSVLFTTISLLLLVCCVGILLAYSIGVSTALADASGVPGPVWGLLLLAVILYFLRLKTLNATVASALMIGGINVGIILILSLLALPHVTAANLSYVNLPVVTGRPFDVSLLGLIFGVVLTAYFGHFSTATCARLVLARDPGGTALLRGNVAAMAMAILVYCLWIVAVNGVVPPSALVNHSGTVLGPLADRLGPVVYVFGSVFVILGMGLSSIHYALALSKQTQEWLQGLKPVPGSGTGVRTMLVSGVGRSVLGLAPVIAIFGVSEWLLLTKQQSFAGPLGFLGVIAIPALGGIFPILMLAASRRKGDLVPAILLRLLGHPAVLVGLYFLFIADLFVHGLWIWQNPLQRLVAVLIGLTVLALTVLMLRRGSFRSRSVIEIRVDRGVIDRVVCNVTDAGKARLSELWLEYWPEVKRVRASSGEIRDFDLLHAATVHLAATAVSELKAWVHQVKPEGESDALSARLEVGTASSSERIDLGGDDDEGLVPLDGSACDIRVTFSPLSP